MLLPRQDKVLSLPDGLPAESHVAKKVWHSRWHFHLPKIQIGKWGLQKLGVLKSYTRTAGLKQPVQEINKINKTKNKAGIL